MNDITNMRTELQGTKPKPEDVITVVNKLVQDKWFEKDDGRAGFFKVGMRTFIECADLVQLVGDGDHGPQQIFWGT
jgi:hypothetical protein